MGASTGGPGAWQVSTNLETVVTNYLRARTAALGTREAYSATVKKWEQWGKGLALDEIGRKEIREFLDWVHERAVAQGGSNPGRTANKAREHLRAVMAWAWEQDLLDALPGFPKPRQHRAVAGRHYLTKEEINALYFATHRMPPPKGWDEPFPVGRFWRCALVVFFNYGIDTGTVWKSASSMSPSCGAMSRGSGNPQTARSRNNLGGDGSSIEG